MFQRRINAAVNLRGSTSSFRSLWKRSFPLFMTVAKQLSTMKAFNGNYKIF